MAEIGEESFLSFLGLDQRPKSRPSCLKTATHNWTYYYDYDYYDLLGNNGPETRHSRPAARVDELTAREHHAGKR